MRTREGRTLQSLRAVRAFLDTHAIDMPGVANAGARRRLDEIITTLVDHVATQEGSDLAAQGATKKTHALRRVLLRYHMAAIARVAKADLRLSPGLEPLRMPKGNPSVERLASAAYGMAKAAAAFSDIFIAAGLPDDFIQQLTDAADALLACVGERAQCRGARGGATEGIRTRLSEGRKIVAVLDVLVTAALAENSALLANWNIVKRVQRSAAASTTAPSIIPATDERRTSDSMPWLAAA